MNQSSDSANSISETESPLNQVAKNETNTTSLPRWKLPPELPEPQISPHQETLKQPAKRSISLALTLTFLLIIATSIIIAYEYIQKKVATNNQNTPSSETDEMSKSTSTQETGIETILPGAVNSAKDVRRKADLVDIATALNVFITENDAYNFPSTPTCIGTAADCFDLEKILVPNYLGEFPKDPTTGTKQNTGYSFYLDAEKRFTLTATSGTNRIITVIR